MFGVAGALIAGLTAPVTGAVRPEVSAQEAASALHAPVDSAADYNRLYLMIPAAPPRAADGNYPSCPSPTASCASCPPAAATGGVDLLDRADAFAAPSDFAPSDGNHFTRSA